MCHESKWLEFCEWGRRKPRAYFLGMGDYDDLMSTSERDSILMGGLHDSTVKTLEKMYADFVRRLAKECSFMKGRCVGILGGNHFANFVNGTNSDQLLAQLLETKYLGVNSFIRLILKPTTKRNSTHVVDIFCHHGRGGGRRSGGSINPVEDMARTAEADIYLMGHNHQKTADFINRLSLKQAHGTIKLHHRKALIARTGSFLKGYQEDCQSYIVDSANNPTDLGVIKIELTPKREMVDGVEDHRIDIHCSI